MYKENKIVAAVVFAFFSFALGYAYMTIKPAARLFPIAACTLGMLFSAALFIYACVCEKKGIPMDHSAPASKEKNIKTILFGVLTLAYVMCITRIGWLVSTLAFMVAVTILYAEKRGNYIKTVFYCVITVLVLYLLFTFGLKTSLPSGILI